MGHFLFLNPFGFPKNLPNKTGNCPVLADDVCLSLGAGGDGAKSYCSRGLHTSVMAGDLWCGVWSSYQ